ncbi:MAG TPA: PAS domain S-box protein [Puia sp.]|nr:PAS domain S-box protein [Puia sp.]
MKKNERANILIVDDKVENIFALEQILSRPDRNLIQAISGKEALKIVLNKDIDLVVLDVQMPGMDGFEVAQILKSNKRTKDIPIIFASAEKKEHQFALKGFEEGAVDYLYKPLDTEITEAKVSVLLRLQLQKKELVKKNLALEKYALLINNSADIICIINPRTLKFEEVNYAVNTILGYTPEEIKGSPVLFYLDTEDRPHVQKLCKDNKEQFSFETRAYSKERAIKWLNWNIVNKNGLWFANARDITDIKEVEEIKSYLSIVVRQSEDAIYLHDPEGKIISWNEGAEKIYGFSEAEACNMKIWNIVPKHLLSEMQAVINAILKGKKIESQEMNRITKYGKMIDVAFSASVIADPNGNLKSVAITEREITQQKKARQEISQLNTDLRRNVTQLEATNNELESFSYSVSHDLRAPLRSINAFSQTILEEYNEQFDGELKRLFGIILLNAKRMGLLIDDLLAFSRLGKKAVLKVPLNFNELVRKVVNELEGSCNPNTGISIHDLKSAEGDQSLIYQVFTNLISNAIKYSSKRTASIIEIGFSENSDEYIYYVKDNGTGFNMDYAHKLFGVFQRLHSNAEFEGTGVGLAIVKRVILKHDGRVWAEGQPDQGAIFYFSLPKPLISILPLSLR